LYKTFFIRENYYVILLFVFSAFIIYFTNVTLSKIYFLILLFAYLRSNNNVFWIAFSFILLMTPGGFFSGELLSDTKRIPVYQIISGFSFSYFDIFFIISIYKGFLLNKKKKYFFNNALNLFIFYGIVIFTISLSIGINLYNFSILFRSTILPILFFYIFPKLGLEESDFLKLFKIILPFVILSFIGQIYEIFYAKPLVSLFKDVEQYGAAIAEGSEEVSRSFDAIYLHHLSYFIIFILIISQKYIFPRYFLILLLFLSFIVCFTSATRGPFIMYSIILLAGLFIIIFYSSQFKNSFLNILLFITISILLFYFIKTNYYLSVQVERAFKRISSIEEISKGDIKSVETRVEIRIPKVMKNFKESPVFGTGFSDEALKFADGHIGMHNMLREGGIIGMLIYMILFFNIFNKLLIQRSRIRNSNIKNTFLIFIAILIGLLFEHTTSTQYFGYLIGFDPVEKWFMLTLLFAFFNEIYYKSVYNTYK